MASCLASARDSAAPVRQSPHELIPRRNTGRRYGKYFGDLEPRIDRYCKWLSPGASLVFFYLNYDNPVSADEYKYALVGWARLRSLDLTGHFRFDKKELDWIRGGDGMKNFPTLNWAIRVTHEGGDSAIKLPYQQYLAHIEQHPEDRRKLREMRVLIDEPALVTDFKYVSEQIDDDHCLALLYKLKRAFSVAEEHGIATPETPWPCWTNTSRKSGGIADCIPVLALCSASGPIWLRENHRRRATAAKNSSLRQQIGEGEDLLATAFALLESKTAPTGEMLKHKNTLRDARAGFRDHRALGAILKKLNCFLSHHGRSRASFSLRWTGCMLLAERP